MNELTQQEEILLEFYNKHIVNFPSPEFTWLNGRSYSDAFVICLGAGPWKYGRRKAIQGMALDKLAGRDLLDLAGKEERPAAVKIDWYPLAWQNKFLERMVEHLWSQNFLEIKGRKKPETPYTMEVWGAQAARNNWDYSLNRICRDVRNKGQPKVLSLYNRDALKIDAFPIDRHVKRKLKEIGLPDDKFKIINMCNNLNLRPNKVASLFVRVASNMDNPDWSIGG